jgi:hypothetical protein
MNYLYWKQIEKEWNEGDVDIAYVVRELLEDKISESLERENCGDGE